MDLWSFPHWTTDSNNWRAGNNHLFQLWMMTVVQSFHVMWENMQSNSNRRTTQFRQRAAAQHSTAAAAAEGECLPTYCFSSTQGNWTHFKGCVCACVYSWVFSVPALHGDYCVMWITCHCWVFSVPHRASGVRFKHKHTGSSDTLRSHQSAM